jgi:cytochrome c oxidase cbb3-type subunit 3
MAFVLPLPEGRAQSRPTGNTSEKAKSKSKSIGGAELYARYCQLCHGVDATGYAADDAPSLVSPTFLATANDAFIAQGIRFGRPETAMAAYGKERGGPLDDAQIAAIVRFLRSKGPRAKPLPELEVKGDPGRGAQVFTRECRSCHGTPEEPGKAPKLHNPEFLAAASPAFLRHAVLYGRPPTRMPGFEGRLRASQVDDVVAWLISLRSRTQAVKRTNSVVRDDLPLVIHPRGKTPDFSLRDGRFVSAEQVKRALADKRRLILIDARSPSDWIQFHIPGAVPIPYYDADKLDRVPKDGTWVVAYCACPHHASGEVVDALRRRGYPNTAVLDEGILFWRRSGYPLEGDAIEQTGSGGRP